MLCVLLVFVLCSSLVFADLHSSEEVDWDNPTTEEILRYPLAAKENWNSIPDSTKEEVYIAEIQEFSQEFAVEKNIIIKSGDAIESYDGLVVVTVVGVDFIPEDVPEATVLEDGTLLLADGNTVLTGEIIELDGGIYVREGEIKDPYQKVISTIDDDGYIRIKNDGTYATKGSIALTLLTSKDFVISSEEEVGVQIVNALPIITTTKGVDVSVENQRYPQNSFVLHKGEVTIERYYIVRFGADSSFTFEDDKEKNTFSTEKGSYLCFSECKTGTLNGQNVNPSGYLSRGVSSIEVLRPTKSYDRDVLKVVTVNGDTITANLENPTYDTIFVDTVSSSGDFIVTQRNEGTYSKTTIIDGEVTVKGLKGKELKGNRILSMRQDAGFTINTGALVRGSLHEIGEDGTVSVLGPEGGFNLVALHGGEVETLTGSDTVGADIEDEEVGELNTKDIDDSEAEIDEAILAGDYEAYLQACEGIPIMVEPNCGKREDGFESLHTHYSDLDQKYWNRLETAETAGDYSTLKSLARTLGYDEDLEELNRAHLEATLEEEGELTLMKIYTARNDLPEEEIDDYYTDYFDSREEEDIEFIDIKSAIDEGYDEETVDEWINQLCGATDDESEKYLCVQEYDYEYD
jgi:hypothetical protein